MPETVYVLLSDGSVMAHDLPLPAGIADRVTKGQLSLVNEDGSALAEPEAPPAPEPIVEPEPALEVVEPVVEPEPEPPAAPKRATAKPKE